MCLLLVQRFLCLTISGLDDFNFSFLNFIFIFFIKENFAREATRFACGPTRLATVMRWLQHPVSWVTQSRTNRSQSKATTTRIIPSWTSWIVWLKWAKNKYKILKFIGFFPFLITLFLRKFFFKIKILIRFFEIV